MPNKLCYTGGQRQEMPPPGDRIISNASSLICDLDSATVFPDLLKHDLVTKKEDNNEQRQEMPPLRDRIISNSSSLIRDLDSATVFPDLLKHGLVTKTEINNEQNNQPNKQNRFILIKLIENCGELDKEIDSILYKQTSIHQILQGPILARRWPKRGKLYFVHKNYPVMNFLNIIDNIYLRSLEIILI